MMTSNAASAAASAAAIAGELGELDVETFEVKDYLDNGNITNSVNFPAVSLAWAGQNRVSVLTKGADAAAITAAVPGVKASASATRGDYGCFLLDTDAAVDADAIAALPGVLRVRVLNK